jgi:transposase
MAKLCNHSRIKPRRNYEATSEEDTELRQLVTKGYSCYRICQIMGISQSVGQRWLAERDLAPGQPRPAQRRELKTNEEAEFRRLYRQGASVNTLAKAFGMGGATVRRILSDLGLDTPPRAANKNHVRHSASQSITINAQEASQKQKGDEEAPRVSIAAKFRREGLATADPYR